MHFSKFASAGALLCMMFLLAQPGNARASETYQYASEWPQVRFDAPADLAADVNGNLYVVDEHRVLKFNQDGALIFKWGKTGSAAGQFNQAEGIALDPAGDVYVADSGNHRVQKFDQNGNFILQWGGVGTGPGRFTGDLRIAADADFNIYVADAAEGGRIQKFDSDGNHLLEWSSSDWSSGWPAGPRDLAIDSAGNVYVLDAANERIQTFDSMGAPLNDLPTDINSQGVTVDANGNILVSVGGWRQTIIKLDYSGNPIAQWAGSDLPLDHVEFARVVTDPQGRIYVIDRAERSVVKLSEGGELIATLGQIGYGAGYFYYPQAIAVDPQGNQYITDFYTNRVNKLDPEGNFLLQWGGSGAGDGEFGYVGPAAIAVDSAGYVYVADTSSDRIQKFDGEGNFVTKWGGTGTGDGELSQPKGIAVDADRNVYVADSFNDRIQKFDADGNFLMKWGGPGTGDGEFSEPMGIAVAPDGSVYVADNANDRIQRFDSQGNFLMKWGGSGSEDGRFSYPVGIGVDSSGSVYVAESFNQRVQKFSAEGALIAKWGGYGSDPGHFREPVGLAVDSNNDIYVIDSQNQRIQKFSLSTGGGPQLPRPSELLAVPLSESEINLTWQDNSDEEEGFVIERKHGADGAWTQIAQSGVNETVFRDSGLDPAASYYYRARSYTWSSDSVWSDEASATTIRPSIAGSVTDEAGNPMIGYRILAFRTDVYDPSWQNGEKAVFLADTALNWTETDGNGDYAFSQAMEPGSYKLKVFSEYGGHVLEWWQDKLDYGSAEPIAVGGESWQRADFVLETDQTLAAGSISINNGDTSASFSEVRLNLEGDDHYGGSQLQMRFSNEGTSDWTAWEPFSPTKNWVLAPGSGTRRVWAQFKGANGQLSFAVVDQIEVQALAEIGVNGNTLIENGERVVRVGGGSNAFTISLDAAEALVYAAAVVFVNGVTETVPLSNVPVGSDHWETTIDNATNGEISIIIDSPQAGLHQQVIGRVELIDPSGYVTDEATGGAVVDALVTLYRLNPQTGLFEIFDPAESNNRFLMEPDINPQRTDSDGHYGWDVAPGTYNIVVQADGYHAKKSRTVVVPPPVIDLNVSLKEDEPPTTPELTGSASGSEFLLSWTASNDAGSGVAGYRIYDADSNQVVAQATATALSQVVRTPVANSGYYIKAYDAVGNVSAPSNFARIVDERQMSTRLAYVGDSARDYSDNAVLSAVLTDANGSPLAGQEVVFTLGTQEAAAVTDVLGQAQAVVKLDQTAGLKDLSVGFAGDGSYLASQAQVFFEITRETLSFNYSGDSISQNHLAPVLKAKLAEGDASLGDLAGKQVIFAIGNEIATQTMAAATDGNGLASTTATIDLPAGVYKLTAAFAGDGYYQSVETTSFTFVVWEPIAGLSAKGSGKILKPGVKKAEFGFHIKYPKTATSPEGEFEYEEEFKDASGKEEEIELESTAINWLVVSDGLAIFDGQAAFEHQSGVHTFRVFAYDGGKPGAGIDTFELYLDGLLFASGTLVEGDVIIK